MFQFYLCGSGKVAAEVKGKLVKIIEEVREVDAEKASEIFKHLMVSRFATDVFE